MSYMDYCKFQNTADDLAYCLEAICERSFRRSELSESEQLGYDKLVDICKDIVYNIKE